MDEKDFDVMKFQFKAKLTIYLLSLSFLYFFVVTMLKIPPDNVGNTNTIVGFIIFACGGVFGYYYGASQSQQAQSKKDGSPAQEIESMTGDINNKVDDKPD
jgi:hypothetical protein